ADASFSDGKLTLNLYYPNNPEPLHTKLPEQPEFGVKVYDSLLKKGSAVIADSEHPIKPASSGIALLLDSSEGLTLVMHRRDKGAGVHKLHHSINAGYGSSKSHAYSPEGLVETALRELCEELMLFTKDKEPWIVVPKGLDHLVAKRAQELGLDFNAMKKRYFDLDLIGGWDTLNVYDNESKLFTYKGFISPLWESVTSLTVGQRGYAKGISADEIIPSYTPPKSLCRQI
ncbi:hypothetical protein HZC32_01645, partial [Candidatus Woesearchaeota archaeon]|nr:hypothetical protein [Candidatus Woesearchaeota archaeon]